MMGTHKEQDGLFSYCVNLDTRVRADHPLRAVLEGVDFSFVREEVAGFYGTNGNPSVDPVVLMKMMFLLFFDDVASERELMNVIPERLDYMWFLGYRLDDTIPHHSVLSKARKRWGAQVFEALFLRIVCQCVEAGLVQGDKVHVDASFVRANASRNSVIKGCPELIEQLRSLYRDVSSKLDEADEPADEPTSSAQEGVNKQMFSTTDPDAAMARHNGEASVPRYKSHRAVDDLHGVITATEITPGDIREGTRLANLVEAHEQACNAQVQTVVADSAYGTVENLREFYERGVQCHMADYATAQRNGKAKGKKSKPKIFPAHMFAYDEATDTYRCPAGQLLQRIGYDPNRRRYEYKVKTKACATCPLRSQCTRAKRGAPRSIKRHLGQQTIDAARAQTKSYRAKKDRVRRKWLMEGSFADAANNHGFKRARWRRLINQRMQDYLIAAVQNVRTLLSRATIPSRAAQTAHFSILALFTSPLRRFWRRACAYPSETTHAPRPALMANPV